MTTAPNRPDAQSGLLAIFRDITAAQTAERLSQQWRQRYERIAAVSGQLVYYHDAATNAVEWGESVQQVFGYTRAELTGGIVQWANLLHPADRQRVLAALAAAVDAYEDHYRLQHKLGHYLLIHTHILPMHTAAGALLGYVGVVRDVSRQHQLQQAVLTHARRLEQLQELSLALSSQHSPDGLRSTIVQGAVRVLDVSAAALYAVEPVRGALRRVASEPPHMTDVIDLQPAAALALQVLQTQQMQQTDRTLFPTDTATPALTQLLPAARMGVPLLADGALGAVLIVEDNKRTTPFGAEDEQLLRLIANQAAAELAKGQLLADTTMRAQRLLLVNEITTAVIQVIDLPVVLQHIVSGLAQVLGADEAAIALFDEAHQQLAIMAHHTPDAASMRAAPGDVIGEHLLRLVLQTRRPVYVADVLTDARTVDMRSQLARRNVGAVLVIPVAAGEEMLGMLVADFAGKQHAAQQEDDLRIGETLANLAAVRIQQVRLYNTLQRLSIVDELTQVYNFRALFEIGENEFARACQQQRPLSAIFIDIDHFGEFNTRYSHLVGNQVLRAVGRRLLAITRQADLVARFGGEEFVVLLPETDAPLATTIGYRIHQEISKLQVATDHGPLGVTVSVGVAARTPEMRALQDLINRANAGEHRAKAEGRNRVVVC
jgi:diguanylate cyclase (GGDEF)-like protein/PAS domain S-box-containing protein